MPDVPFVPNDSETMANGKKHQLPYHCSGDSFDRPCIMSLAVTVRVNLCRQPSDYFSRYINATNSPLNIRNAESKIVCLVPQLYPYFRNARDETGATEITAGPSLLSAHNNNNTNRIFLIFAEAKTTHVKFWTETNLFSALPIITKSSIVLWFDWNKPSFADTSAHHIRWRRVTYSKGGQNWRRGND